MPDPNTTNWRETVRDLYDDLHFGQDNLFTGSRLAKRLIAFIEDRHPSFFNEPHAKSPAADTEKPGPLPNSP